jgi:hypothetical protein
MTEPTAEQYYELQTKYDDLLIKLKTWRDVLCISGVDSKTLVRNEIEKVLVDEKFYSGTYATKKFEEAESND